MQKKTHSILEELESMYLTKDKSHLIESRASNILQSSIHLLETIDKLYSSESAEDLQRKFINAIKNRDPGKFTRSLRRKNED